MQQSVNKMNTYYCVKVGKNPGIYKTWDECKQNVIGYPGAIYKKFTDKNSADQYIGCITNENTFLDFDKAQKMSRILTDEELTKFESQHDNIIHVYTDGCSLNLDNTERITGFAVYFGENDARNTSSLIDGTNNRAELSAIIRAMEILNDDIKNGKNIIINTDSQYSILCLTNNKKNPNKPNYDIIMRGYELMGTYDNINFHHVRSHTNNTDKHSMGNAKADEMANLIIATDPKINEFKFTSGKYIGKTYDEIYNNDKQYFELYVKNSKSYNVKLFYDIKKNSKNIMPFMSCY